MKKHSFLILLMFCVVNINLAQTASRPWGSYYNLEKYWFYRYRLVNDFMKIGSNCGESLPFAGRLKERYSHKEEIYTLTTGGEVPIHLGDYIAALATEHRLLQNTGLSTYRTQYELDLALNAFERIDRNTEAYTYDFINTKTYASNCQPQNAWSNKLNGFFIRDDVPYQTFVYDNLLHFNRPGSLTEIKTKVYPESALDRYESIKHGSWPSSWEVCVPHEESQDGVVNLSMGLALTSNLLRGSYWGLKASENLQRIIEHIALYTPGPSADYWKIYNPNRFGKCVYGDKGDNNCFDAGAVFSGLANGAIVTSIKWGTSPILMTHPKQHHLLWQYQQVNVFHEDYNFWGTYAALADNWKVYGVKSTWSRMKSFAKRFHEGMPHLPYLYRVMNPGSGAKFMFEQTAIKLDEAPPCGPHNYYGDYSNRITWDTKTFVHNGPYSWHWSGPNLTGSYYSRDGWKRTKTGLVSPLSDGDFDGAGPRDHHIDYNGIDYMLLFNLFSLQDDDYIKKMFNSYYRENFDMNLPNAAGLGSSTKRLKLNFLEYVSAINKINSDGCFTIRCAKKIDLLPGFEVKTGGKFLTHIEDYFIDCGSPGGESSTPRASEEYHYAEVNEISDIFNYPQMLSSGPLDTTYFLNYPPDGVDYIADSAALEGGDEDSVSCSMAMAYFDSLVASIYASGDPDQIAYIDSLIPYVTFPECDSTSAPSYMAPNTSNNGSRQESNTKSSNTYAARLMSKLLDRQQDGTNFNIFPNPSNGHFTFAFAEVGEYDIKIYDALGSVVFQTHVYSRRSEIVHIDGLANGIYTAEVVNSKGLPNKRIRKLIIAR